MIQSSELIVTDDKLLSHQPPPQLLYKAPIAATTTGAAAADIMKVFLGKNFFSVLKMGWVSESGVTFSFRILALSRSSWAPSP